MVIDYGFRDSGLDECRIVATDDNLALRGLMNKKFGLVARRIEKDQFNNECVWTVRREDWADGKEREGSYEED